MNGVLLFLGIVVGLLVVIYLVVPRNKDLEKQLKGSG